MERKLTIRFGAVDGQTYHLDLEGPDVGQRRGDFAPPYDPATWQAIMRALEPGFTLAEADEATRAALQNLGGPDRLHETAGAALAHALLADEEIREGFEVALALAEKSRQALPVELRFGEGCDALAALPWELLHHKGRFLLADTSIALSRYPEGAIPPTEALAGLPLRVLLALSEPVDASPIFSQRAREELLHGLHTLDEAGAVVVDLLRPPTFEALVEAVVGGGYHVLAFYGHGSGGQLFFEDEFGGPAPVRADELGAALRNADVRLVLLGACQSAQAGADIWGATAPALLRAGVPLAIGMQVSMRVDAALAFIRQFALSLSAGEPVIEALGQARKPLVRGAYGQAWFIPALYGRPSGDYRLFDPQAPLPEETAGLRAEMKARRAEIAALEQEVGRVGVLTQAGEIARLRAAKAGFARARAELARRAPGGYAALTSPLYGVPSNPAFVGRAEELRRVSRELKGEQPVVIWGTGGIGKTALAVEVAHRQGWRFPAGVLWLDCRGGPAFDSLLDRIGAFCGLAEMGQVEPGKKETTVRGALAGLEERCLLVWDNAEDVWSSREVRRFVESLPSNCQALITTREDPERAMWPTVELRPLADETMTALFYRLASSAGVKVGTQEDLDAIPHIVGWLRGHPLALMLVVPLAKRRPLRRVWADLQERPLKGIEAAFEASYERLSSAQQRLFARLSVFKVPFEWEAAEALLPGEAGFDEVLDVLVQRALVAFDGVRYAYHALLRQYAYGKLREMEDPRPAHKLAAECLHSLAQRRARTPDEGLEEVDQWEKAEEWEQFARSASALVGSLDKLGYWGEIGQRLERARQAVKEHLGSPPELAAGLLSATATIAYKSAAWDEAIALWEEAADLCRATGDEEGLAWAYNNMGAAYLVKGDWGRAIESCQQSLKLNERLKNIRGLAHNYHDLGQVYAYKGNWERAFECYQKSLEFYRRLGDVYGQAAIYNDWGEAYRLKGEWGRAFEFYQQSLELNEQLEDIHSRAKAYNNLGLAYAHKGEWSRAIESYQKSLELYGQVGDIHGQAATHSNLGEVYRLKGEWDRAIELYQNSLQMVERLGDIHGMAQTYNNLGSVYLQKGEWERAIEFYYQKSLELYERVGDAHSMAGTYNNLGEAYRLKGERERAFELYQQAWQIYEQFEDIQGMAVTCMNLGTAHMQRGEWEQAIEFYQRAMKFYERAGDIQGMAQTYNNLGIVYAERGEWEQAIEFYRKDLEISERMGDIPGQAGTWTNMGMLYLQTDRAEEARPLLARAYLVFAQIGSPDADTAARALARACGSVEAANAYLEQLSINNEQ